MASPEIDANLHPAFWSRGGRRRIPVGMADEPKKPLGQTYIRAWRKHRQKTQAQVAEALDITEASVSRIEKGTQPYNQRQLEQLAQFLNCSPGDLLDRDPNEDSVSLDLLFRDVRPDQREQVKRVIEAFTDRRKG